MPFAKFVEFISPKGTELSVISRQIANAHMTFNILNTLLWLPLIPYIDSLKIAVRNFFNGFLFITSRKRASQVKIVMTLVRSKAEVKSEDENKTNFLDRNVLSQPMAAIFLISKEIKRASDYTLAMLYGLRKAFKKSCKPELTSAFNTVLHNIDRIGNDCGSIAEEVLNDVRFVDYSEPKLVGFGK